MAPPPTADPAPCRGGWLKGADMEGNKEQCVARNPHAGGRCQRMAVLDGRCVHHTNWQMDRAHLLRAVEIVLASTEGHS